MAVFRNHYMYFRTIVNTWQKNNLFRQVVVLGNCLACAVLIGCGHRVTDLPPMAEAGGTVTLDGRPLPRGIVQFVPDSSKGTRGPSGVGDIDADGRYEIRTAGVKGAMIGWHKIRVNATEEMTETNSDPPSIIPSRYSNPNTSTLTAEVKAEMNNVFDLKLTSQP